MPRAIGWAPVLLLSRSSVIARPKVQSGILNIDSAAAIGDRGSCGRRFATRCPNSGASVTLRHPMNYRFFRPFQFFDQRRGAPFQGAGGPDRRHIVRARAGDRPHHRDQGFPRRGGQRRHADRQHPKRRSRSGTGAVCAAAPRQGSEARHVGPRAANGSCPFTDLVSNRRFEPPSSGTLGRAASRQRQGTCRVRAARRSLLHEKSRSP